MTTQDPRTDEALVAAINGGDERAFEALYRRHSEWTFRLALRFTADEADAADVAAETFTYLLSKFPGFVLTARLTTFLYPVVKHNAMAQRRNRKTMKLARGGQDASELDTVVGTPPPTTAAEGLANTSADPADPRRAGLAAVLSCLPEPQREVVLMRFVHAMTMEEIGAALSIPTGTVKSRLHHALATLRADPLTRSYFGEG